MDSLYHIIIGAALLAASPLIALRMAINSGFRRDICARLQASRLAPNLPGCIWVHASSVGEVRVAKILIQAIRAKNPNEAIALSTFSGTGFALAEEEGLSPVFRLPPDFPYWMNPVFDKLDPSIVVLIEAELWPGLLRECKRRKIPTLVVNGRMSRRSQKRYQQFRRFFLWITEAVTLFSMRGALDRDHLLKLGIDERRTQVTGNIKFDASAPNPGDALTGKSSHPPTVVFGSTRPGEEKIALEAIRRLKKDLPDLICVIAPRHMQRCPEVERLIEENGLSFQRHSERRDNADGEQPSLILVDQLGALNAYYRQATVAFVGGGMTEGFGGHNILEPAAHHLPVLFGRHMNNFAEEARLLKESGGGIELADPFELAPTLHRLLTHPEELKERGDRAAKTIAENRGALARNLELIEKFRSAPGSQR